MSSVSEPASMVTALPPAARATPPPSRVWMHGPWQDTAVMAFNWLPLYLLALPVMLTTRDLGPNAHGPLDWAIPVLVVLSAALSYPHRDETFLIVFGDGRPFLGRPLRFYLTPIVCFGLPAIATILHSLTTLAILYGVLQFLDFYHTTKQQYGILRAYAAKARGGLETATQARTDLRMCWLINLARSTMLLGVFGLYAVFHVGRALDATHATRVALWCVSGATLAILLAVTVHAARLELGAKLTWSERAPRLLYWASMVLQNVIIVAHAPTDGVFLALLLGPVSHSIEYMGFASAHQARVYANDKANVGLAARIFRSPARLFMLTCGFVVMYFVLETENMRHREILFPVLAAYFFGNRVTHILYDGWIWKLRRPEVRQGLTAT